MTLRRIAILTLLLASLGAWITSSQTWATAELIDSQSVVEVTGQSAYPQVTVLLLTGLLILWLAKYLNSVFSKFITSAIVVFLIATASPIWFESASGSLSILTPEIAKLTGISDWLGQAELIRSSEYNHFAADSFVLLLVFWSISLVTLIWSNKPGGKTKEFVTRIDNLPSW